MERLFRIVLMRTIILFCSLFIMSYASAQTFEPKWVGQVIVLSIDKDTIAKPTEKATMRLKSRQSAHGSSFDNGFVSVHNLNIEEDASALVRIMDNASLVQLDPTKPMAVIVKSYDNRTDPHSFIQIVEFEKGKNDRKIDLAMGNWAANTSDGKGKVVPFEAEVYGTSSYILKLQPKSGEFGVIVLDPHNRDERLTTFNCFGTSIYGQPIFANEAIDRTASKDGTFYKYNGFSYPVYKKTNGRRYIALGKYELMYLPIE